MKIGLKTIFQYLLFVGLPLLGVLGALGIGRNLGAPAAVHGTWALAIPLQPALECQVFAGWNGETQMAISQSGPDLIIVFSDKALPMLEWIYFSRVVPKDYQSQPEEVREEATTFSIVD